MTFRTFRKSMALACIRIGMGPARTTHGLEPCMYVCMYVCVYVCMYFFLEFIAVAVLAGSPGCPMAFTLVSRRTGSKEIHFNGGLLIQPWLFGVIGCCGLGGWLSWPVALSLVLLSKRVDKA